ncbi:MAG: AMP-binding protein, partial [Clostridia bacterium]|nr:AMP-binding protein [Clostridia bacterium]
MEREHRFVYTGGPPPTRPWYKFWPPGLPKQLDYPRCPTFNIIEESAKRFPDKVAVNFYGREITYRELYDSSINLAGYLSKLVKTGSRVAVCIGNAPHWHICAFGVHRANAVLTSVNPLLSADEIEYVLRDSGAEVLICLSDRVDEMLSILGRTSVRHVICGHWRDYLPAEPQPEPPEGILTAAPVSRRDVVSWLDVVSQRQEPPEPALGVSDPALIIYTSGTTGVPKGVVH